MSSEEIDFSKTHFKQEEIDYIKRTKLEMKIDHHQCICIVLLDSKVLSLEKYKFIIPKKYTLNKFEKVIKNFLHGGADEETVLEFRINEKYFDDLNMSIGELYTLYKHPQLNILIFTINKFGYKRMFRKLLFG